MDGVLVNRERFFKDALGEKAESQKSRDEFFDTCYSKNLFTDVSGNRVAEFKLIMKKLFELGHSIQILTSYGTHGGPTDMGVLAHVGKVEWLNENYGDLIRAGAIEKFNGVLDCAQKKFFAAPESILIDDQKDNILGWIAAGGIGLLYEEGNHDKTISELLNLV